MHQTLSKNILIQWINDSNAFIKKINEIGDLPKEVKTVSVKMASAVEKLSYEVLLSQGLGSGE